MSKNPDTIIRICESYANHPSALIEILHEVQHAQGYLSKDALVLIASTLNISRADIHGVVSFYDDFLLAPIDGPCVKICRAEACQAVGGEALAAHAKTAGIQSHDVYCLGNCALGPTVMIDNDLHGRVTPQKLDELMKIKAAS